MSESAPASISDHKARIAQIFGRAAATYDSVIPFFAHWGARLVAHADLTVGERVLDVCCGTGSSLFPAASTVGLAGSVVGVDLAPEMVAAATDAAIRLDATNVTVEIGDAEALDFDDASFDAVLCGFGIMFMPDPPKAIAEMKRVLRPGGRLVVSVPQADLPAGAAVKERWLLALGLPALSRDPSDALAGVDVVEEPHDFVFDDADAYVAWCRSLAARGLFDLLDDDDLVTLIAELTEAAESERTADGIVLHAKARFWRATKGG